jgi:hypothetical protein
MGNTSKFVRMKVPTEFRSWAEVRRINMEKIAREFGYKKRFSMNKTLKVVSKSKSDISIDENFIRDMLRRR